jgi:hypothetical protein
MPEETQKKTIVNVWTVYRIDDDGEEAEEAIAEFGRPQDWGDNGRWMYRKYVFEAEINGVKWRNEVHCWGERPLSEADHMELFAPLAAQMMEPCPPVELCSNTHLDEDDFWSEDWGPQPPVFEDDDDAY